MSTTPEPMPDEHLAQIEARVKAATPEPFHKMRYDWGGGRAYSTTDGHPDSMPRNLIIDVYGEGGADREFYFNALGDVGALLGEVLRLRREVGGLETAVERSDALLGERSKQLEELQAQSKKLTEELFEAYRAKGEAEAERDTANARELRYWEALARLSDPSFKLDVKNARLLDALAQAKTAVDEIPQREYALHKARLAVVEAAKQFADPNSDAWQTAPRLRATLEALEKLENDGPACRAAEETENGGDRS